jgi:hypothetical protein
MKIGCGFGVLLAALLLINAFLTTFGRCEGRSDDPACQGGDDYSSWSIILLGLGVALTIRGIVSRWRR